MTNFIVDTAFKVYSPKDWKFTIKMTIKFKLEMPGENEEKGFSYFLNFLYEDVWKYQRGKKKEM